MKYDGESGLYTLSTGTEVDAHRGILGLSAGENGEVFSGYDGRVFTDGLTVAERREIAEYMSALWMAWAAGGS